MEKAKILLSGKARIQYYIDAVQGCGADAVAEYLPQISTEFDGLILCGGNDVDPAYYNEPINGSVDIDYERDKNEFALLKAFIDAGKPVFGICRGFQLINIYFGGSLHQDIKESALHKRIEDKDSAHTVKSMPNSIINSLYTDSFSVNSAHHQALKKIGEGLVPTAIWNDQYIEAFEHVSLPIIGVQWHPERTCFTQARNDTVDGAKLFEYFVSECERHKK